METADHEGVIEKLNVFEDGRYLLPGEYPEWWYWYSWPAWWRQCNGVGRITWKTSLPPEKSLELAYLWHYFWR